MRWLPEDMLYFFMKFSGDVCVYTSFHCTYKTYTPIIVTFTPYTYKSIHL